MAGIGAAILLLKSGVTGLPFPTNVVLSEVGGFVKVDWSNAVVDANVVTTIKYADEGLVFTQIRQEPTTSGIEEYQSSLSILNGRVWRIQHVNLVTGVQSDIVEIVENVGGDVCNPPTNPTITNISFCSGPPQNNNFHLVARADWVNPVGNTAPVVPEIEWFYNGMSQGLTLLSPGTQSHSFETFPDGVGDFTPHAVDYKVRLKCGATPSWSPRTHGPELLYTTNPCSGAPLLP